MICGLSEFSQIVGIKPDALLDMRWSKFVILLGKYGYTWKFSPIKPKRTPRKLKNRISSAVKGK